jgi:plasmid stabilization system protein ParE
MKYRLRISPAADADVDAAALFIAQDNLPAALRFFDAVQAIRDPIWGFNARLIPSLHT